METGEHHGNMAVRRCFQHHGTMSAFTASESG
jgi:hypothetical protein